MASPHNTARRSAAADSTGGDGPLYAGLALAVLVGIGLPAAVALGVGDERGGAPAIARGTPGSWVPAQRVRGTSRDGDVVQMRVSIDAPDARTRDFVGTRRDQVALVMQISLSEHDTAQAAGAERVQQLAQGIQDRLNDYLQDRALAPVRDVVIEDMVIGRGAPDLGPR
jgi:hypothetical protein